MQYYDYEIQTSGTCSFYSVIRKNVKGKLTDLLKISMLDIPTQTSMEKVIYIGFVENLQIVYLHQNGLPAMLLKRQKGHLLQLVISLSFQHLTYGVAS